MTKQGWFRFYNEALDDPKVQRLPGDLFKFWVNVLCFAQRNRGFIGDAAAVSFAFRCEEKFAETSLELLRDAGLLDKRFGKYTPHNWFRRQYISDVSTERVKRFRKRSISVSRNGVKRPPDYRLQITDSDSDSDSDCPSPTPQAKRQKSGAKPKGASPSAPRRDVAADAFATSYATNIGTPYGWHTGDFPQLAKLRKRLGIPQADIPADWDAAMANYFATPLAKFTLQHFATEFDTFKNSALDRYHVPVNHASGGNGNGRQATNTAAAQRLRARLDSKDRGGG